MSDQSPTLDTEKPSMSPLWQQPSNYRRILSNEDRNHRVHCSTWSEYQHLRCEQKEHSNSCTDYQSQYAVLTITDCTASLTSSANTTNTTSSTIPNSST
ncbi:hypothetical protein PROFUN_03649 [Planoprotostelium fungivorum]|uniref:Uncharacterized protein n=1 Tax=Planoprotostelium fungivorum TaxID=1890364 RepID=A0A2P6NSG5_9EUKA|nr:hypothetical protein PROFUN_03649 [Planoprotostelium fungivorum]